MPRRMLSKRKQKSARSKPENAPGPNPYHILALAAVCAILISAEYHGPNYTFDDAWYVTFGKQILNGTFNPTENQYSLGYLMPGTVADSYLIFGQSPLAATIPSMAEYVVLVLLIYLTALRIKPISRFAFQGAFIAATSAFIAVYSSRVLSDMLIGALVALSLYLIVIERPHPILAGATLGLIMFVKFGGMIAAAAVIFAVVVFIPRKQSLKFIFAFVIVVLVYLTSIGWNLHALESYSTSQMGMSNVTLYGNIYTMTVLMFFNYGINKPTFAQIFSLGGLVFLAVLGIAVMIYRRERSVALFALVFAAAYLYLFLGTEGLPYHLITVVDRYMIWIASPMAIMAAYFLSSMSTWYHTRLGPRFASWFIWFLVAAVLLSNIPLLVIFHYWVINFHFHS